MVWGKPETMQERILTTLLAPAGALYGMGSYLRLRAYGAGCLKRQKLPVPVISIGNLTCGGTGKTPVTVDLARRLIDAGRTVAILSRGYRRQSKEELLIVSDGQGRLSSCSESGDEPYMMAQAVPAARVIVCAKRAVSADIAVKVYDADVILLDDGFQHLAIERDHDIVLIDYNDDPSLDHLLPAGRLREPLSALGRAGWLVITRVPNNADRARLNYLQELLSDRAERAIITSCRFVPEHVRMLSGGMSAPSSLSGVKVVAACGIARPQAFFEQLEELNAKVVRKRTFADHHWWCKRDIDLLTKDLLDTGAELVITTEKDAVRFNGDLCRNLPLSVLAMSTQWLGPPPAVSSLSLREPEAPGGKVPERKGRAR